jgi:hypothetical protein
MKEVAVRRHKPARYRLPASNTMAFPRELREAIPDLPTCVGRVLHLDSITADYSDTQLFGTRVHVSLRVRETGKLKGKYTVRMDLLPEAARQFGEALLRLAGQAGPTHSRM